VIISQALLISKLSFKFSKAVNLFETEEVLNPEYFMNVLFVILYTCLALMLIYCTFMRNAYKIAIGKPEVKRPLRRQMCRWEDNIKMDLTVIGWEGVDWIHWLIIGTSGGLL